MKLRSFWKFHIVVVQNNGKGMYKKKFATPAKFAFWLIRPIAVFHRSLALPLPFTRFYILFEQTIKYYRELRLKPWLNLYIIFLILCNLCLGGVYMTPGRLSPRSEFTPVPSHGSIFDYMITPQNVMLGRVTPA